MARYNSIDSATWESAKLDKVVPKIEKKAKTDQVKSLAKQILQLVVDFKDKDLTKKAEDTVSTTVSKSEGASGINSAVRQKGESLSSRKTMSRDSTPSTATAGANKRPETKLKKPGADPASKAGNVTSKTSTNQKANAVKPSSTTNANASSNPNTNPSVKIKANPVTAKPTSFFSSLQSASKKPGTSNAAIKTSQQNIRYSEPLLSLSRNYKADCPK